MTQPLLSLPSSASLPLISDTESALKKDVRKPTNLLRKATDLITEVYTRVSIQPKQRGIPYTELGTAPSISSIHIQEDARVLGKGTFSIVKEVYNSLLHEKVALKVGTEKSEKRITDEAELLWFLNSQKCPNISQIRFFDRIPPGLPAIGLKIEGPSLQQYFKKKVQFTIEDTLIIARDILIALKGIAKNRVIHGDLSAKNITYDERRKATLIDFGNYALETYRILPKPDEFQISWYRAPEVILNQRYDSKVDVWSLALCLYQIYTSEHLFFTDLGAVDENREIFGQIVALLSFPPLQYLQKGADWGKYCKLTNRKLSLTGSFSEITTDQMKIFSKERRFIRNRFVERAIINQESPDKAAQLGDFVSTLLSYERPTAAEALDLLDQLFVE